VSEKATVSQQAVDSGCLIVTTTFPAPTRAHVFATLPQVRRLAQLSLLAVMRDIVPGYRVRLPTEKELLVPVSKDVQCVRDYESTLLRLYQVRTPACVVASCADAMTTPILVRRRSTLGRWQCRRETEVDVRHMWQQTLQCKGIQTDYQTRS